MAFDSLLSQCRHARWNLSINRNVGDPHFLHRRNQGAGLARVAIKKTFAFERSNVLHHRCLARESEVPLNLARAWRDSFFALLALDKIENVFLALSQHPS